MLEQEKAEEIVVRALRQVFTQEGLEVPGTIDRDTVLVGTDAVIDSLGVVSLIVEIEQIVEAEHTVSIILANERAMSQKNSPFRTVGVLSEHVVAMVTEAAA
jgi:acyl carrier protein